MTNSSKDRLKKEVNHKTLKKNPGGDKTSNKFS